MLADQIYRDPLDSFTDREQILKLFEQFLHTARPGLLRLLAVRGNSGTGKTSLISYLSNRVCPKLNWRSGTITFAVSTPDFRSILTGLEDALKSCVPNESLKEYRRKRDQYNHSFDEYRTSITNQQHAEASNHSSLNVQQIIQVNIQLRDRELQLRAELTRALIELAEESQASLCWFIDGYERLTEAAPEEVGWLWEEVIPGLVRASSQPLVVMTCGWEVPGSASVRPFSHEEELTDFAPIHVRNYLERQGVLSTLPDQSTSEVQELVNAFYDLTKGHPLMLSLAVTYFYELAPHERTARNLQMNRTLVDEQAQVKFLNDCLILRLKEPQHRMLLERGPLLRRYIDQASLGALLAVSDEGTGAEQVELDDRTYNRFLQYPFINRTIISNNGSLRSIPMFHELVRRIGLERLRQHPQTRDRLHRAMVDYYERIVDAAKLQRISTDKDETVDEIKWVGLATEMEFEARLEWLYHSLQLEEIQENTFITWQRSLARAIDDWLTERAWKFVELIQQLEAEGEPCFSPTGKFYGAYLYWLARYLILEARWEEAQTLLETAVEVSKRLGDGVGLQECFSHLGWVCQRRGMLDQAFFYFDQAVAVALSMHTSGNRTTMQATTDLLELLTGISEIFREMGRFKESLDYNKTALSLFEVLNDRVGIMMGLNSRGLTYSLLGEFKQAFDCHQRALSLLEDGDAPSLKVMLLINLGRAYKDQEELEQALKYYKQALSFAEQIGDPDRIASCLSNMGYIYWEWRDFEQAEICQEQALALREQLDKPTDIAMSLQNTGALYLMQGRSQEALNNYKRALALRKQVGNPTDIALSLRTLGDFFQVQGNMVEALSYYEQVLALQKQLGNPFEITFAFNSIGHIYQEQGNFRMASDSFQQALAYSGLASEPTARLYALHNLEKLYSQYGEAEQAIYYYKQEYVICEQLGDTKGQIRVIDEVGNLLRHLKDFEQLLDWYEQALPFLEAFVEPFEFAKYLNKIGEVYYRDLKEPGQALYYFERVLPIIEKEADANSMINYLYRIGNIYKQRGREEQALSYYKQSADLCLKTGLDNLAQRQWSPAMNYFQNTLALEEKIDDLAGILMILQLIGSLHFLMNEFDEGVQYIERALRLKEQAGDVKGMAESLSLIAGASKKQGKLRTALDYYQKALKLLEQLDEPIEQATALHELGDLSDSLDQPEQALNYYQKALVLRGQLDDPADLATTLHDLGYIYKKRGELEEALDYYQRAMKIRESLDAPMALAETLNNIGTLYSSSGKMDLALDYYQRALELREKGGDPDLIIATLNNIGMVYYREENFEQALSHFERVQTLSEQADDESPVNQSLTQTLNVIGVTYMKLGDFAQATTNLERALIIREQEGVPTQLAESLHNLGSVYYKQRMWSQAIDKLSRALSIFETLGRGFEAYTANELSQLAECYNQMGEAAKSYDCQQRLKQLHGE